MQIPWYVGTLIGAILLTLLNTIKTGMEINIPNTFILLPILVLCNYGFWYGFRHAPVFLNCWFLGTALTVILGVLASVMWFHQAIALKTVVAIALALTASWMLI